MYTVCARRSALGELGDRIETVEPGYRMTLGVDELDVSRFDALAASSARLDLTGEPAEILQLVDQADELWRGRPYDEFADEPWARVEVARLDEVRTSIVERKAAVLLESGRQADAGNILERLIHDHPLRERPRLLFMRALYGSGRQAEALRAFQDYRRLLIDEVGVEPSEELVDLDRAIARGEAPRLDRRDLAGAYELHERIGQGAFAVVHKAVQRSLQREVAVKIIRAELANQPSFIRRFETEAKMVARIEHPHVVPLYDFWRDPDRAYLVMRYMPGGSLEQRLATGPLSVVDTLRMVDDVADGLEAAHEAGLIHRDVKPANVLFDDEGRVYLSDFGIAMEADAGDAGTRGSAPEAAGLAGGTGSAPYSAPERLRGEPASRATDVYGLAITAFTALAGHAPFADGVTPEEAARRILEDPLPGISGLRTDLPTAVDDVLASATAKHSGARQLSPSAFAAELRAAAEGGARRLGAHRPITNPYKGLRAFDEGDAADFHGRERLVDELVSSLAEPDRKFLLVVGPSGSGKSSVVRAGLVPALRADRIPGSADWFATSFTPGPHPFEALETALLRVAVNPPAELLKQLRSAPRGILRAVRRILPDDQGVLLLVIDQFEELFTSNPAGGIRPEQSAFLNGLATAAAAADSPLRIVATLRADFYDRPLRHGAFAALIKRSTVTVTPLAPDELEEVIVRPAADAGVEFEAGLVAEIMAEVAGQPGSLPLLQFALTQAFDHSDRDVIRRDDYDATGGIAGALAKRADELHDGANPEEQAAIRQLFGRLVALGEGTEDTRRRVLHDELGESTAAASVLDRFGAARLLAFDRDPATRQPTVEVAHEALIRQWPRLRDWLDEDRDGIRLTHHLHLAASEWDSDSRPSSELYRGGRLEATATWAADHRTELRLVESDFLQASLLLQQQEIAAEQERFDEQVRSNRRLRTLLGSVAVLLALAMVAGAVAFQQRGRANDNAAEAAAQADTAKENARQAVASEELARAAAFEAETGRLVATAQSLADTNPRAAMLLSVAAHQRSESPATLGALQTALSAAGPLVGHLGWGTEYIDVEWLVNDRIVAARVDGIDLFDPSTGEMLDSVDVPIGRGFWPGQSEKRRLSSAANEPVVVLATDDSSVQVFDVGDRLELRFERGFKLPISAAAVSADGRTYLAADTSNTVTSWDDNGDRFVVDLSDDEFFYEQSVPVLGETFPFDDLFRTFPVRTFLFPFDDHLLAATGASVVRLDWDEGDVIDSTYVARDWVPGSPLPAGAISVEADAAGNIMTVSLTSFALLSTDDDWPALVIAAPINELLGAGSPNVVVASTADDGRILAQLTDGTIRTLETTTGALEQSIDAGLGAATAMTTSPEGDRTATAHPQGVSIMSLGSGGPISAPLARPAAALSLSISRDGGFVVMGPPGAVGPIAVWRHDPTGKWFLETDLPNEGFSAAVFPEPGDLLKVFVTQPDGVDEQFQYSLESARPTLIVAGEAHGGTTADLSPDQTIEAVGGPNVDIWEFPSYELVRQLPAPPDTPELTGLSGVRFSPAGDRLLVSSPHGRSQLYDTEAWTVIDDETLAQHDIAIGYWNADATLLATASSEGKVSIRDGETFEIIRTMVGAVGTSNSWNDGALLFSEDDRFLLTNFDGPGRLWDVDTGEQVGKEFPSLPGTNSGVNYGETFQLITASETSGLIWNLDVDQWADIACAAAGSNLTPDEWIQWGPRDQDPYAICGQFPLPNPFP